MGHTCSLAYPAGLALENGLHHYPVQRILHSLHYYFLLTMENRQEHGREQDSGQDPVRTKNWPGSKSTLLLQNPFFGGFFVRDSAGYFSIWVKLRSALQTRFWQERLQKLIELGQMLCSCIHFDRLATHGSVRNSFAARLALRRIGAHYPSLCVRLRRLVATRFCFRFWLRLLDLWIGLTYFWRNGV